MKAHLHIGVTSPHGRHPCQRACAGTSYYSSDSAAPAAAGFKQYCAPARLAPEWHGLELRYGKSPLDATSVFRFFVLDAAEVQTVYTSDVPANQILWKVPGPSNTPRSSKVLPNKAWDLQVGVGQRLMHMHCAAIAGVAKGDFPTYAIKL